MSIKVYWFFCTDSFSRLSDKSFNRHNDIANKSARMQTNSAATCESSQIFNARNVKIFIAYFKFLYIHTIKKS